jgi:hypothetical protein
MNQRVIIGFVLFLLILGGGVAYRFLGSGDIGLPVETTTYKGYVGGEKMAFLQNEEVQKILERRYGVKLDYAKAGSIEMVQGSIDSDIDFLWPSSQVALELFKNEHGNLLQKDEIIFNSPIVLYSWDIIADALEKEGIVRKSNESYYIVDFPKMMELVESEAQWADIGVTDLYGKISVISTDPSKSNSGNMFSGLLANIINGDVVSDDSIGEVLPRVRKFFVRLGYMEHSSSDLFEQYLRTGIGAKPIIVGYESQIIEFSIAHAETWPKIKDKIRILYPEPTVWSSHPMIIVSERARELLTAFEDPEIQKLAWEKHGFRTGLMGIENDVSVVEVIGIPENITKVIPMPPASVMDKIINEIKTIQ